VPIYEFYCADCHRIFSFLARGASAARRPACPRCGKRGLVRQASRFAVSKGRGEPAGEADALDGLDEGRLEQAMASLSGDLDKMDQDDPRQMATLMRKLYGASGLALGPTMDEAIRRLEAGEDPDEIEEEMGDALEQEDPFAAGGAGGGLRNLRRRLPPSRDETLYEL
jgi:putative FmdB family regulatory protein